MYYRYDSDLKLLEAEEAGLHQQKELVRVNSQRLVETMRQHRRSQGHNDGPAASVHCRLHCRRTGPPALGLRPTQMQVRDMLVQPTGERHGDHLLPLEGYKYTFVRRAMV